MSFRLTSLGAEADEKQVSLVSASCSVSSDESALDETAPDLDVSAGDELGTDLYAEASEEVVAV